jgi:WD40 repeat protein
MTVVALTLMATFSLKAQTASDPIDFEGPAEVVVAPSQIAWCSAWSPDEQSIATCYGFFQGGEIGRLRVWDPKSGKVKWEARESRGIRRAVFSPDGSLLASCNWGNAINFRDAATGELRKSMKNTGTPIECISFSSDGRRLVSGDNSRTMRIWDVATGQVLKTIEGQTNVNYGVQFSPDDTLLVAHGRDRSVRIWRVDDGQPLHVFMHPREVNDAIFLPDGKQTATVCADGQVRIFNVDSGELVIALPPSSPEEADATAIAVSRDGKFLAASNTSGIRIWKMGTWKVVATLKEQPTHSSGLAFSTDAKTLISSDWSSAVRVWDVPTESKRLEFLLPPEMQFGAGRLRALAISPDGKLLAAAAGGNLVELRERRSGEVIRTLAAQDVITGVAFAPSGKTLATAGGSLRLWDVERGAAVGPPLGEANVLAWSPDGKLLAGGGSDKVVRLWDAATSKPIAALEGHRAEILALAFSPDGKRLLSASGDFTARVWDIEKQTTVATLQGHAAAINAVAYAADGKTLATASNDGTARLWGVTGYRPLATLAHQEPVVRVTFSPGGQTLITGGEKGTIRLWNTAAGTPRKQLAGHTDAVTGLVILPDGSGLVSGSADQSIRFWKAAPPALPALAMLPAHGPEALSVAFSPDGKWLITGGADKTVAIRDPASGSIRRVLRGHTNRVTKTAVSPDSKLIASVSGDGTVRVWSIQRGEQDAMYNAWHEKFAAGRSVAFSSDGRFLASGADDGAIKLWSVTEQKEVRVLEEQSLPITCLAFSKDGAVLISSTGDWRNNQQPGELRLWDVASGQESARLTGHASEIKCIAVDPTGTLLASTAARNEVKLWNLTDRSELKTIRLDSLSGSLAFSPDGKRLAMGHYNGSITLWDVPGMALVQRYAGHTKGIPGIAFHPDGKLLATTSTDAKLGLWPVLADSELPMR